MSAPDDREPGTPPPPSPDPSTAYLPPRLRAKLEQEARGGGPSEPRRRGAFPVIPVIVVIVVAALGGGGWWMLRQQQEAEQRAEAERAAAVRAAAVADSLQQAHIADSLAAVARADSLAFAALPRWKQRQILEERARAAGGEPGATPIALPPPPADDAGRFSLDVGQYLDESRADEIAAEMNQKTGLAARVVVRGEGANAMYEVHLGDFDSRSEAQDRATRLLQEGKARQAAVTIYRDGKPVGGP